MFGPLENLIAWVWNRGTSRPSEPPVAERPLDVGAQIMDGEKTTHRVMISQGRRAEHLALLGRTGSGKSSLLKHFAEQDLRWNSGFLFFDFHGDATTHLVGKIAEREKQLEQDLSGRLILIRPADVEAAVGFNPLQGDASNRFLQITEMTEILRRRWHLDTFGARTDELLRNSLYVLADNKLTLLEVPLLLSDTLFRASCLRRVRNPEVRQYFELRYDPASGPMQAVMREPILNKLTILTGNPHFRVIIGQRHSTFSILQGMDSGAWIILDFNKGILGEQAVTLASIFFTWIKNASFARRNRRLFTIYADEIQNLVASATGLEAVLSESRKFACGVASANQYLDQYSPEMRSAILAIGTHIFFRLSSADAQQVAAALDGGKPLAELLKNLPNRHAVVKTGHERWREVVVPTIHEPKVDTSDLVARSQARWGRRRIDIEADIAERQAVVGEQTTESLDGWE